MVVTPQPLEAAMLRDSPLVNGTSVRYRIRAIDAGGLRGAWSAPVEATPAAGTRVAGFDALIDEDTVWVREASPYILGAAVSIAPGRTLTIEPGVVVLAEPGQGITVGGRLLAVGAPESPIVFSTAGADPAGARWAGLEFDEDAAPLSTSGGVYVSGSRMAYVVVEFASDGAIRSAHTLPALEDCAVRHNTGGRGAGVYLDTSAHEPPARGAAVLVARCTFEDNTANALWLRSAEGQFQVLDNDFVRNGGGAVSLGGLGPGAFHEVTGNLFERNTGPVAGLDFPDATRSNQLLAIVGANTFRNNSGGEVGAMRADGGPIRLTASVFTGNRGQRAGALLVDAGASLQVSRSGFVGNRSDAAVVARAERATLTIEDSLFADSVAPVVLSVGPVDVDGAARLSGSEFRGNFADASVALVLTPFEFDSPMSGNALLDRGLGVFADAAEGGEQQVDATDNWWGTSDPELVARRSAGPVDAGGPRASAPWAGFEFPARTTTLRNVHRVTEAGTWAMVYEPTAIDALVLRGGDTVAGGFEATGSVHFDGRPDAPVRLGATLREPPISIGDVVDLVPDATSQLDHVEVGGGAALRIVGGSGTWRALRVAGHRDARPALQVLGEATPTLLGCVITGNDTGAAPVVHVGGLSGPQLRRCTITENSSEVAAVLLDSTRFEASARDSTLLHDGLAVRADSPFVAGKSFDFAFNWWGPAGPEAAIEHAVDSAERARVDFDPTADQAAPPDADGDGLPDAEDPCPLEPPRGDADGDGLDDGCDPCPELPDEPPGDEDRDGVGDACDRCAGGDDREDGDGDGTPDACDLDWDNDGVPNYADPLPHPEDRACGRVQVAAAGASASGAPVVRAGGRLWVFLVSTDPAALVAVPIDAQDASVGAPVSLPGVGQAVSGVDAVAVGDQVHLLLGAGLLDTGVAYVSFDTAQRTFGEPVAVGGPLQPPNWQVGLAAVGDGFVAAWHEAVPGGVRFLDGAGQPVGDVQPDLGLSFPRMVSHEGRLFVRGNSGRSPTVRALDADLSPLWDQPLPNAFYSWIGIARPLALVETDDAPRVFSAYGASVDPPATHLAVFDLDGDPIRVWSYAAEVAPLAHLVAAGRRGEAAMLWDERGYGFRFARLAADGAMVGDPEDILRGAFDCCVATVLGLDWDGETWGVTYRDANGTTWFQRHGCPDVP